MPLALPTAGAAPVPASGMLDGPPPSPQLAGMPRPGEVASPLSLDSNTIPPEVLTGIQEAGSKMRQMIESFAQMTPDLSADWAAVDVALGNVLGKLQVAGASPAAPTSPGTPFPGGGFEGGTGPAVAR